MPDESGGAMGTAAAGSAGVAHGIPGGGSTSHSVDEPAAETALDTFSNAGAAGAADDAPSAALCTNAWVSSSSEAAARAGGAATGERKKPK